MSDFGPIVAVKVRGWIPSPEGIIMISTLLAAGLEYGRNGSNVFLTAFGSHKILVFPQRTLWQYPMGTT